MFWPFPITVTTVKMAPDGPCGDGCKCEFVLKWLNDHVQYFPQTPAPEKKGKSKRIGVLTSEMVKTPRYPYDTGDIIEIPEYPYDPCGNSRQIPECLYGAGQTMVVTDYPNGSGGTEIPQHFSVSSEKMQVPEYPGMKPTPVLHRGTVYYIYPPRR